MTDSLSFNILGLGAWGPGFSNWPELRTCFKQDYSFPDSAPAAPKPQIIPANERRRAPLMVRIAVEVSSQAIDQAQLDPREVACVFGSGLGDTEITDYMCRQLSTEEKALSPTKFHNSVHNAAAGYWTISTDCMKAANSIAAYQYTAGQALIEGVCHSVSHQEPVLITLFDIAATGLFGDLFSCRDSFAAAILINAQSEKCKKTLVRSKLEFEGKAIPTQCNNLELQSLQLTNPSASILPLLQEVDKYISRNRTQPVTLASSSQSGVKFNLEPFI